jgi:DNA-binding NarL/FixJ family response regulator
MRLLVIDDELLVLEGLEAFLHAALPDHTLDKTADIDVAVEWVANVPYGLVLLDWNLLDDHGEPVAGAESVQALRHAGFGGPIVVVSGDERREWPVLLMQHGLSGYVPKAAPGTTLIDAIHVALRGGVYLPAMTLHAQARAPLRRAEAVAPAISDPAERFPSLTPRQADVFRGLARGLSDKQIARELGVFESTVKTHVRAILGIVGVGRRGEAVYRLTGNGHGGAAP